MAFMLGPHSVYEGITAIVDAQIAADQAANAKTSTGVVVGAAAGGALAALAVVAIVANYRKKAAEVVVPSRGARQSKYYDGQL